MTDVTLETGLFHPFADPRFGKELLGDLQFKFQRTIVHHQMNIVVINEFTARVLFENLDRGIILVLGRLLLTRFATSTTIFSFLYTIVITLRDFFVLSAVSYLSSSTSVVQ